MERKKRCLESDLFGTGQGGLPEAVSAEASPERQRWRTLKGNQAQGSSERGAISNEGASQRTRQWSKALKAALSGKSRLEAVLATGLWKAARRTGGNVMRATAVEEILR